MEHGVLHVPMHVLKGSSQKPFNGLAAELYVLCDAARSVRALMEAPSVRERLSEGEVVALLDQFVEQGLMIHSGKQYLSLAVVREHSSQET